jgi:D5 N terminal like/Bifunctional DNA primase/polymerase, N-terminal
VLSITPAKTPYDYETGYDRWFTEPQTEDQVREIFSNGAYGIALMAWPASNLCVLDFDGRHAVETWEKTGIVLPETARNFTQSGYFHLIFEMDTDAIPEGATLGRGIRLVKADCDCKKSGKPKPCGVDFLINGYFIVPPTKNYREDPDRPFENFAKIPAEVVKLAAKMEAVESVYRESFNTERVLNGVPEGERDESIFKLASTLRGANVPQDIAERLILEAARNCDPPFPDDKALEKVARAYRKYKPRGSTEKNQSVLDGIQNLTDLGNAKRFADMHKGDVFYSAQRRKWVIWTGKRWQWDETGTIFDYAERVIQEIYAEASRQKIKDMREAVSAHAVKSESRGKIEALLALAQGLPDIRTDLARFDKNLFLLNATNATIELETGTARPFKREDYITRMAPTLWDEDAECPLFMDFMDFVTLGTKGTSRLHTVRGGLFAHGINQGAMLFCSDRDRRKRKDNATEYIRQSARGRLRSAD